jgi:hypothetical protein
MDFTAGSGDVQDAATDTDRSRKRKVNAHAQSSLQFVNPNPQSEVERRDVRQLVRANATKFRWRQTRKASARSSNSTTTARRSLQPIQLPEVASDDDDDEGVDAGQASHVAIVPSRKRPASVMGVSRLLPVSLSSPLNLIRIGNIDLFEPYPSELPKEIIRSMLPQGW